MTEKIKLLLTLNVKDTRIAEILKNSLFLETEVKLSSRSRTKVFTNDSNLLIQISATDYSAARAAINSWLLWLNTNGLIVADLLNKDEWSFNINKN